MNPVTRRLACVISVLAVVGCGATPQVPTEPTQNSTAQKPATVASQIDPQWLGLDTAAPWNLDEVQRRITGGFQQFGLRPADETELPRGCNGCGANPATTYLTVYEAGEFDPSESQLGQRVLVGDRDGFFVPADGTRDATLAWQYADQAWATVRGTTSVTSDVDRMLELAEALRPDERTPIRVPLRLADVPESLPLASITVDDAPFGTTLSFAPCAMTDDGAVPECLTDAESLDVRILPTDGYDGYIDVQSAQPSSIGGRDGFLDQSGTLAAVQVTDGMLVVFDLDGSGEADPATSLTDVLTTVEFASNPGDDATWPLISDWTQ